jgi:hypothetical protein
MKKSGPQTGSWHGAPHREAGAVVSSDNGQAQPVGRSRRDLADIEAAANPCRWNIANISATVPGAQATSKPPLVGGR